MLLHPSLACHVTVSSCRHHLSLSEQQRRQQRQLHEFFAGVDVLASTEASSTPLLDAADQTLEGMLAAGDGDAQGGLDGRGWVGSGAGVEMGGYGPDAGAAGEEGTAAVAVRKSVYHLRQLRQVGSCRLLGGGG